MKKIIMSVVMAVALISSSVAVAQTATSKSDDKTKTECCSKDKKACDKKDAKACDKKDKKACDKKDAKTCDKKTADASKKASCCKK